MLITYDEAILMASNADDFALKVKGIQSTSDMSLEEDEQRKPGVGKPFGAKTAPAAPQKPGEAREYKPAPTSSEFKIDRFGDK